MDSKKNIDRLFQEKFKDFEAAPSDAVWDRINESLPKKKKKRRVIALWWQVGGVAALIALLLTVGISVFNSDDISTHDFPIVNTEGETDSKLENNDSTTNETQRVLQATEDDSMKIVESTPDSDDQSDIKNSENPSTQKPISPHQLKTSKQQLDAIANSSKENNNRSTNKQHNLITVPNKNAGNKVANQIKTDSSSKVDKRVLNSKEEIKSTINKTISKRETAITDNTSTKQVDDESAASDLNKTDLTETEKALLNDSEKQSIEEAIAENRSSTKEKEINHNRWSIAPNVAPVYFNSLGQGSSLDQQFNKNSKNSDVSMSYGITGSYTISKKLKVRTGVNRVNLNQTTSGVYAYTGAQTVSRGENAQFKNIEFTENAPNVSLISSKMMNTSSTPQLLNSNSPGHIEQKFGFIEVPLELEYRLIDKKIGINVIGGFSTFILNENEIYADVNGASILIGEAKNLNNTSFSANFGLGMDYSLSKQWNINLEPTFKYQINTFNNTSGKFNPFFIGVYTGLQFKF